MTEEMKTAIQRLEKLPPEAQAEIARNLNSYLDDLEVLRGKIESSLNSGQAIELSKDQLLQKIRSRHSEHVNG